MPMHSERRGPPSKWIVATFFVTRVTGGMGVYTTTNKNRQKHGTISVRLKTRVGYRVMTARWAGRLAVSHTPTVLVV